MLVWRSYQRLSWLGAVNSVAGRPFSRRHASKNSPHDVTEEEIRAARSWLDKLSLQTVPRSICEISFSRSSGPGGQNVNKVNTKVTLKVPLSDLLPLVPSLLHTNIRASRFFAGRSNSLVIHSDETRKQSQNLELCFGKLRDALVEAGKTAVPGETSAEQRQKVKQLQQRDNENRMRMKKAHSHKKSNRRNKGFDD